MLWKVLEGFRVLCKVPEATKILYDVLEDPIQKVIDDLKASKTF